MLHIFYRKLHNLLFVLFTAVVNCKSTITSRYFHTGCPFLHIQSVFWELWRGVFCFVCKVKSAILGHFSWVSLKVWPMLSLVGSQVIRILCILQIGILTHQTWNQIKKKANEGKKIKVSFKFSMILNQEVMVSVKYCIQLCVLWLLYRALPREFPDTFFIDFSSYFQFYALTFSSLSQPKKNKFKLSSFIIEDITFSWYFFLYLNLFMLFFWSISHISICILKYVWHLWLLFGLFTTLV